ncbi:MAG TPA: 3-deoxy-7-phosphoheptulonate synthase [Polyangiaceae bacterium]|nr:3-deoxy-7-phosphoheptulonate synthase [Polyangiaceae bacterium]
MPVLTDDVRIDTLKPLLPPAILMDEIPLGEAESQAIAESRRQVAEIIEGKDDRLLVVVGPCSIHDPQAGLEYARRLQALAPKLTGDLQIVMRTYFEKPRTTVGWKGLINDPKLDGSFAINQGLRVARTFLRDVVELGLPTGLEFLDPITPQFMADLVTWGAIGARTTESQVHRELASGLSMPVGFKNGTGGTVQIAADAVRSAAEPHHFLSVTKQGLAAIVATRGNPHCHVILRGGANGPNYGEEAVGAAVAMLEKNKLPSRLMIDTSHANSGKDPARQPEVAAAIARQVAAGNRAIFGVMLESFLVAGRQEIGERSQMTFGQSVTDGCLAWDSTVPVLEGLAEAVRARRARA